MGMVKSFNGIFAFLAAQFALLLLIASENVALTRGGVFVLEGSAGLAGHLMVSAWYLRFCGSPGSRCLSRWRSIGGRARSCGFGNGCSPP